MAGNSKTKDLAGGGPVGDQLKALLKKAWRLADEKAILSKHVVAQIKKLTLIHTDCISRLEEAERKEINVSVELEKWLEDVYGGISRADDLLDYCDYHIHDLRLLQLAADAADRKKSKGVGLICGEKVHRYLVSLVRPVSTYLVRPVSSRVATIIVHPINHHLVMPLYSRVSWWKTTRRLNGVISNLNLLLKKGTGSTQISGEPQKAEDGSGSTQISGESQKAEDGTGSTQISGEPQKAEDGTGSTQISGEPQKADDGSRSTQISGESQKAEDGSGSSQISGESQKAEDGTGSTQISGEPQKAEDGTGSTQISGEPQKADDGSRSTQISGESQKAEDGSGSSQISGESQKAEDGTGSTQISGEPQKAEDGSGSTQISGESQKAEDGTGSTQISGESQKAESEEESLERSARRQGLVDVSDSELKIVGEKTEVDKIVSELLYYNNHEVLSVKRIVGWRETGKTALARAVYKNEEVMFHFDERMWVQVPGNFDKEKIAESMLASLTRTAAGQVSNVELTQEKLKARLKGKRYLLVLDGDFEVNSSFIEFLQALGGCRDSKILATVGSVPDKSPWSVYEMKLESKDYCPTLFDAISIGDEVKDDAQKEISADLVKDYCQGDLLSIKLLGSLMKRMKGERRWLHLSNKLKDGTSIPQLCFDSMSSLPLKRCFQYCCLFRKGYLIQREEITELWMAQGYLNNTGTDMLELGILYYDILLKSGFLQVSEEDDFDKKSCKVPEPLWDVVVLRGDYLRLEGKEKPGDCSKVGRHLSLVNRRGKLSRPMWRRISELQTLCLERNDGLNDKLLGAILAYAKSLRVLIIVDPLLEELPSSVGKLKGLKYLDISRTKVVRLPDSISVLYNLHTLRLYCLEDSPKRFENLGRSLRHLYIQMDLPTLHSVPSKLQGLLKCSKGSIKVFVDKNGEIDVWEKMKVPNRCSSISIHRLENARSKTVKVQTTVLLMKCEVETLKLHWSARRENCFDEDEVLENIEVHDGVKNLAIENFKGTAFPTWMLKVESNRFLHKLELENCSWCEKLPPLGTLCCLKILRITKMNSVRDIGDEFYHGPGGSRETVFPALKVFILSRMKNLHNWHCKSSSENAFSSLVRLEVEECPELSAIPDALVQNHLLKLRIAHCAKLTALPARITEEGEEFLVRDLELFGLPSWQKFSIQGAKKLNSLKIGCISTNSTEAAEAAAAAASPPPPPSGLAPEIQFNHLTTLSSLTVWGFGHKELPSWISQLTCLKILKLELSETLESFPQDLKCLKELRPCFFQRIWVDLDFGNPVFPNPCFVTVFGF